MIKRLAAISALAVLLFYLPGTALAWDPFGGVKGSCSGTSAAQSAICQSPGPLEISGPNGIIIKVANVIAFIAGIAAVILIIIGAIRYITAGDANGAAEARRSILYALVGLAVIVAVDGIIVFVLGHLK